MTNRQFRALALSRARLDGVEIGADLAPPLQKIEISLKPEEEAGRNSEISRQARRDRLIFANDWFALAFQRNSWWRGAAPWAAAGLSGPFGLGGRRERTPTGAFGKTRIAMPRARLEGEDGKTREWRSGPLRARQRRTRAADALIAGAYLAGTNARDRGGEAGFSFGSPGRGAVGRRRGAQGLADKAGGSTINVPVPLSAEIAKP
jgi:hypothetical protein